MNKLYTKSWSNFFVIYMNELLDDLSSNAKSFAGDDENHRLHLFFNLHVTEISQPNASVIICRK